MLSLMSSPRAPVQEVEDGSAKVFGRGLVSKPAWLDWDIRSAGAESTCAESSAVCTRQGLGQVQAWHRRLGGRGGPSSGWGSYAQDDRRHRRSGGLGSRRDGLGEDRRVQGES